jgi:hypothetical protein
VVVLAGEQRLGFEFADVGIGGGEFAAQFLEKIFALLGIRFGLSQLDVGFDVTNQRAEFRFRGELIFGALAFFQDGLRLFLMVPEIRIGDLLFGGFQARAVLFRVKDSSARGRFSASDLRIGARNLQSSGSWMRRSNGSVSLPFGM